MNYSDFLEHLEVLGVCDEGIAFANKYDNFDALFDALINKRRYEYLYWLIWA